MDLRSRHRLGEGKLGILNHHAPQQGHEKNAQAAAQELFKLPVGKVVSVRSAQGSVILRSKEILPVDLAKEKDSLDRFGKQLDVAIGNDLIANGPGDSLLWQLSKSFQPLISQSAAEGALPTLFAATSPEAKPAGYYGPSWFYELKGPPVPAMIMPQAKDAASAARLWDVSAALTGVSFAPVATAV